MSQTNPFDISEEAHSSLTHLQSLLHLFAHRNKNQHRHSIWWRHFSLIRRQLVRFLEDLTRARQVPTTHLGRVRQKALNADLVARNARRREFWREVLVPRAQDAFSQLVADRRFAVLGLVLVAVLGQMCRILGLTVEMEEAGQAQMERVLEEFGREEWGQRNLDGFEGRKGQESEDFGEIVARGEEIQFAGVEVRLGKRGREHGDDLLQLGERETRMKEITPERSEKGERKKKKRRKKGDAIDDIFGGLV